MTGEMTSESHFGAKLRHKS